VFPEIEKFKKHLRRQHPRTTTHLHYTNDLRLFFAWTNKPPAEITLSDNASYPVGDVDAYIAHSQEQGHASPPSTGGWQRSARSTGSCNSMSLIHRLTP